MSTGAGCAPPSLRVPMPLSMTTTRADLSLCETEDTRCPLCASALLARRWRVVDAGRRRDLVVHAIDGSLQHSYCPACIGPGVQLPGSFGMVADVEGGLQWFRFLVGEADTLQAEAASLDAHVLTQCQAHGLDPDRVADVGSRWVEHTRDVSDAIDDVWPHLSALFAPSMLAGPLGALLGAAQAAAQAAALVHAPDLARPNIELFLSQLAVGENESLGIHALRAREFIAAARSLGLTEAIRRSEADERHRASVATLPPALAARVRAFMSGRHVDVPPAVLQDEAAALCRELAAAAVPLDAEIWSHVGMLLRARPDAESLPVAAQAYALALAAADPVHASLAHTILIGLSAACDLRRDGDRSAHVERALRYATEARDLARSLPVDAQVDAAIELGNLYVHRPTGDPASNLALAREALTFAHDAALGAAQRLLALYNLALTDIENGRDDQLALGIARLEALAAPDVCDVVFDTLQQQRLLQSLGVALARRATGAATHVPTDLDRASQFVERALDIARTRQAAHDAAFLASLLASIEADRRVRGSGTRDLAGILALLDEAGRTLRPETSPTDYALNELRRASVLEDLGEPALVRERIIQAYTSGCAQLTPDGAPGLCRRAQSRLGDLRFQEGDFTAAAAAFATACQASEHVYGDTESVTGRAEEATPNARLYEGLVDSLSRVAGNEGTTAWQVLEAMEAGRARLTLDLMGLRALPEFPGIPADLLEQEARLIAELAWSLPGSGSDPARDQPERLRRQRATQEALRTLWAQIATRGAGGQRYAGLRTSHPPRRDGMAGFSASLGAGAAILSFFVLQDRILAAWLRAGQAPRLYPVAVGAAELREHWLGIFRRDVLDAADTDTPGHEWLALGEQLFAPIAGELDALDLLVVVPHRELHALPLHALTVQGQPLIARVPVVYGPSIGVLASIAAADRAGIVKASPLVASHAATPDEAGSFEGEADDVAGQLGTTARHHATRAEVLLAAPSSDIIHLVCHGAFDAGDPLDSGVLLADGVLRARDWLPLPLRSDLVVLSGCETGRQQVHPGDELNGLARSLLQAGSSGVLLTLWRVYSGSTAAWMSLFYERLTGVTGVERARAFQGATLALRAADADPVAWAPFVLIGRADP